MRLKHFYTWGCFYPMTSGTDLVISNQFEYFRARGWTVDCIIAKTPTKDKHFEAFCDRYHWVNTITPVDIPSAAFAFRDLLFSYAAACRTPKMLDALAAPADLFLTNYVFTSSLTQHVPAGCKRVLETHDIMTKQFAFVERNKGAAPTDRGSLAAARDTFLFGVELDLYNLFDATIMINRNEHEQVKARGVRNSTYVPQMSPAKPLSSVGSQTNYEYDLIFVGSCAPINVRGINWFYRNVFVPYLWRHNVRVVVVGSVCDYLAFRDANVTFLRQIDHSLDPLYEATKLAVIPIFEGTGLSIKTLEGLANGRALVVTPSGARGLEDAGDAFVTMDMKADPAGTAEVILGLLASADRRHALERAAIEYVNRYFSREVYFSAMDRVIEGVGLDPHAALPTDEKPRELAAA